MNAPVCVGAAFGVVESADPAILARIAEPGVATAVWRRPRDAAFAAWIDALPAERLPRLRAIAAPESVEALVQAACDSVGTPRGEPRDRLAGDAAALALMLSRHASRPLVALRLEVVDGDKCRRFHIDRVRCRLLCTYRGAGTQYGAATPGADREPTEIHQLAAGDAAMFRGALWPEGALPGVLHRSPPIGAAGETRLLLAIDPADDPED